MQSKSKNETLPRPDYIHHIVEDFYTSWQKSQTHILPLRRFFEKVLSVDLRTFYTKSCFLVSMTKDKTSQHCKQSYLQNRGLYGTKELKLSSMYRGLILTIQRKSATMSQKAMLWCSALYNICLLLIGFVSLMYVCYRYQSYTHDKTFSSNLFQNYYSKF